MKLICARGRPAGAGGELFAKSVEESTALVLGVDHQTIQKLEAFFLQTLLFLAFLVAVLKKLTYALVST